MAALLAMATALLLALLRTGQLSPSAAVPVLQEIHARLLALKAREAGYHARHFLYDTAVPAVRSWHASLTHDRITCLECGASLQWLTGSHLRKHG